MLQFTPVDFDPFAELKEIEKVTLTNEPQREIWLSCIFGGEDANLSYNESVSLVINGDLNFQAFKKAVDNLVLRHEALRSTISPNGETLVTYKAFHTDFQLDNISALSETAKQEKLHTFLRQALDTPLDLKEGPLFKVYLHKTGGQEYFFTIIKHHVISDGWSTGIMLEDLSKMYNAYNKGNDINLTAASQLSDYAASQANFRLTPSYKQTQAFWLDQYKDKVPQLEMPTDFPRVAPRSYKGNRIDLPLSNDLADQIKAIGAKTGSSLVTTLLAAFEVFLYQKTNQPDIVVGLPSSGQSASELYDVVGNCVNLLPLRSYIDADVSFTDHLRKRKKEVLDAYDHQRITFGELIKKLYIARDPARIPLVPVVFNIDMGMDNAVAFDGLTYKLISNPRAYENFELFLNATRSKEGIILEWSYNTGLFKPETIQGFNADYLEIIKKIITNPDITIAELTGNKYQPVLQAITEEVFIAADTNINSLIAGIIGGHAHKTAVSFANELLTYQQLGEKVNQLGAYLVQNGIEKGDIVALLLDRSIEMLVSMLAVLKIGAAYLPLDPEYPQERIEFMLSDSSAKMLFISKTNRNKFETNTEEVVIDDIWPELPTYHNSMPKEGVGGNDLAYILYTSGSTGKPKGVKITHRNLVNFLLSMQKAPGIIAADRLLAVTTISFDIAGLELFLPLITGAEVVIANAEAVRDGRLLLSIIEQREITLMQATPSTWQMLFDSGWQKHYPLKVLCGGEALPKELALKILNHADELWNMYGPTETTIWSTIKQILPAETQITIGAPIDNTQVYIVNEFGKLLPANNPGELYIGGDGVAAGYLNRPELNAEKFVADTFSGKTGTKLYRTGDLCQMLKNGELQYLGRIDQQVKIRGHRIELGEIENLLSVQQRIKQSVVIAQEDGQAGKYLAAYVILTDPTQKEIAAELIADWRSKLSESLPNYMIPEDFVAMERYPLTPNGKIDRKALPKPDRNKHRVTVGKLLPQNPNEQLVADIWSDVLGLKDLGITDDFFELGGHSLLAVKAMTDIEKKTGKRISLATLFNNSTIQKLAVQLNDDMTGEVWDAIVPIKTTGKKPPLFLFHGSGLNILMFKTLRDQFEDDQPVYGVQAIGLSSDMKVPATTEEICKVYVDEIVRVNPVGPYCLGGYSYGGFLALECAKQLTRMGKQITFLGMIDTNAGAIHKPTDLGTLLLHKVRRQFRKIPFFFNSFINYPKESFEYQKLVLKRKLSYIIDTGVHDWKKGYTDYELAIYYAYNDAIGAYKVVPFDMEVSLFRVQKRLYFLDDQKYLGWDKLALKGVRIYKTPGDHKTFLEPPNDEKFAMVMQRVLDAKNR